MHFHPTIGKSLVGVMFFSRDSDLTSTNVSLSVSQSVSHQYAEIAYKQQSESHP